MSILPQTPTSASAVQEAIQRLTRGALVDGDLMTRVAEELLTGSASPAQIGAFLVALRIRGETRDQLTALARVVRAHAGRINYHGSTPLVDTCGTGGDDSGTFNISTAAALIAAGAGARIAKHGNRAVSSGAGSGSADVLTALGVRIDAPPPISLLCLENCGIAFFFAPHYHSALRHTSAARREIGVRTILNLLGPLANPLGAKRQVVGVGAPGLTETFAQVLGDLGSEHALVVRGNDGTDELTLTGDTQISELLNGAVLSYAMSPESLGLPPCTIADLRVPATSSAEENAAARAAIIRAILEGEKGPRRNVAVLNAAAALYVAGQVSGISDGYVAAEAAIDSGAALRTLELFARLSNETEKIGPLAGAPPAAGTNSKSETART